MIIAALAKTPYRVARICGDASKSRVVENHRRMDSLALLESFSKGQAELHKPVTERQALGKSFFQKAPWNGLENDKVGIESFRVRLQEVLADNTRREFPQVSSPA